MAVASCFGVAAGGTADAGPSPPAHGATASQRQVDTHAGRRPHAKLATAGWGVGEVGTRDPHPV
jgi:hypothetical protein